MNIKLLGNRVYVMCLKSGNISQVEWEELADNKEYPHGSKVPILCIIFKLDK
jgi:hypothetical protein